LSTERLALAAAVVLAALGGCRQDMHDQPKYKPLRASRFFDDGRASRPLVEGTVARGHQHEDEAPPVTRALLERGRERYDIFCAVCHDRAGKGRGMIVERGFKQPPSFHIDRLRQVPDRYLVEVIGNGFGAMPSYAQQIRTADRWAIAAYVRALQLSQQATLADVPADERALLEGGQ
jgi:mono/diheme cytochrome c family protein